jgi:oligopeptide/dipeptide ABC transporter ATP-binding protein
VSVPVLETRHVARTFHSRRRGIGARRSEPLRAVSDVSIRIEPGEALALVGETGCGKTTLARCIVGLIEPTGGTVALGGRDVRWTRRDLQRVWRDVQMVFQDPHSSLNPKRSILSILETPLHTRGVARERIREEATALLERVGLEGSHLDRYPHEFSGGQRQRIGIARALAMEPKLLVCDEPVSALDVSIQSQILNLLRSLQREDGLSLLFITHDLAVVRHMADRVAVMYLGRVVEVAPTDDIFASPRHWYTRALMDAVPIPDPAVPPAANTVQGEPPSPSDWRDACAFRSRCPRADDRCATIFPALSSVGEGRSVACHYPLETSMAASSLR